MFFMGYTNSSLVNVTKRSPNNSGTRTHTIDRITPHCVVGQCSAETIGNLFLPSSAQASCNYGIGCDGRVVLCVDESKRSWCSSSKENDQRAVTIECASDTTHPYAFRDCVYNKLVTLCIDICKRNGKNKIIWFGDKNKTLNYSPKSNEMVLTVHRWFKNKACPGDWLCSRMDKLAAAINAGLQPQKPAAPAQSSPVEICSNSTAQEKPQTISTQKVKEEDDDMIIYRTLDDVPTYGKSIVQKLIDKKAIVGTGETVNGKPCLDISLELLRTLIILDRLGKLN